MLRSSVDVVMLSEEIKEQRSEPFALSQFPFLHKSVVVRTGLWSLVGITHATSRGEQTSSIYYGYSVLLFERYARAVSHVFGAVIGLSTTRSCNS